MSPSDYETLLKKYEYLQRMVVKLGEYRMMPEKAFLDNLESQAAVERRLHTAIESVIDCSRVIVTLLGWRNIKEETDALLILARHDIISGELGQRLIEAKKFRNVLVHMYAEIDPPQVYRNLQEGYKDLQEFARAMAQWLKEYDSGGAT